VLCLVAGLAAFTHHLPQAHLRDVGEILRFKRFDRDGWQVMVCDDLDALPAVRTAPTESIARHRGGANASVQQIVLGGANHVELKSGIGKPDRPPVYSEAYVPVVREGRVIGVVEVDVDQTCAAAGIENEYRQVALTVAATMLLLALPAGWHWMHRLRAPRRAEERVRYLAQHDILSGALNRASFHDGRARASRLAGAGRWRRLRRAVP
jgi:hypothetical protein